MLFWFHYTLKQASYQEVEGAGTGTTKAFARVTYTAVYSFRAGRKVSSLTDFMSGRDKLVGKPRVFAVRCLSRVTELELLEERTRQILRFTQDDKRKTKLTAFRLSTFFAVHLPLSRILERQSRSLNTLDKIA